MRNLEVPLFVQVIAGVCAGAVLGVVFGKGITDDLGDLGLLVIRLLKALAVPLVLFAILDAFLKTKLTARAGLKLLLICAVNVSVAFTIGLTLMNMLRPGDGSRADFQKLQAPSVALPTVLAADALSPLKVVQSYVPESLVKPFLENSVIPVVLLALLVGAALRKLKEAPGPGRPAVHRVPGARQRCRCWWWCWAGW